MGFFAIIFGILLFFFLLNIVFNVATPLARLLFPAPREPKPQAVLIRNTIRDPNARPWPRRSQSPRTREPPVEQPNPGIARQQLEQTRAKILSFIGQDFEVAVQEINSMGYDVKVLFAVERTEYKSPKCSIAYSAQYYYGVVLYVKNRIITQIDIPVDPSGLRILQDPEPCRDDNDRWCKDQPQCINVWPRTSVQEVYI